MIHIGDGGESAACGVNEVEVQNRRRRSKNLTEVNIEEVGLLLSPWKVADPGFILVIDLVSLIFNAI